MTAIRASRPFYSQDSVRGVQRSWTASGSRGATRLGGRGGGPRVFALPTLQRRRRRWLNTPCAYSTASSRLRARDNTNILREIPSAVDSLYVGGEALCVMFAVLALEKDVGVLVATGEAAVTGVEFATRGGSVSSAGCGEGSRVADSAVGSMA